MHRDWVLVFDEMIKPMAVLIIMIISMLVITIGIQFWRDRLKIEKKLGTKTTKWLLEEEE